MKKKEYNNAPMPDEKYVDYERVYLYTKSSRFHNMTSMLQTHKLWAACIPLPYDYMARVETFETGKSNIDSSLWMCQD